MITNSRQDIEDKKISETDEWVVIENAETKDQVENIPIREKTFNKELRSLVEKVTTHDSFINIDNKNIDDMSEDELLRQYHKLFYRSIHLEDYSRTGKIHLPEDLEEENINKYIQNEMQGLGFPEFAILSYNFEKKCYTSSVNNIAGLDVFNLYIDINEEIYEKINASTGGAVIGEDYLQADPSIKKRLGLTSGSTYYMNSLKHLFWEVLSESEPDKRDEINDSNFSPVIIVKFDENNRQINASDVSQKLSNQLSLPFLLFSHNELRKSRAKSYENLEGLYRYLEYFYQIFVQYDGGTCLVLTDLDYYSLKSQFKVAYILSKLYNRLSNKSLITQIEKDKIIIFTNNSNAILIKDLVAEWNDIFNNTFSVKIFENKSKIGFLKFLTEYIF